MTSQNTEVSDAVSAARSNILAPELDAVPTELRNLNQWMVWRLELNDKGKPTKVPYDAKTTYQGKVTDSDAWSTFDLAASVYLKHGFDGVGFVFSPDDDFAGIDLDNCRDPKTGKIDAWAIYIIEMIDSYCEVSPSGTGVKLWCKAVHPGAGFRKTKIWNDKSIAVEMYDNGRYFTFTGYKLKEYTDQINVRQGPFDILHAKTFVKKNDKAARAPKTPNMALLSMSDQDLLERATKSGNGHKIQSLWAGDLGGRGSQSEADLALCNYLMFWFGGDLGRVDAMFRRSGLMRDKWDEQKGQFTYGERTLNVAAEGTHEYYDPARGKAQITVHANGVKLIEGGNGHDGPPLPAITLTAVDDEGFFSDTLPVIEDDYPEDLDGAKLTDIQLAQMWADENRTEFAYVEGDQWWIYKQGRWQYASLELAQQSMQEFLEAKLAAGAKIVVNQTKVRGVLFLAKSKVGPHLVNEFDSHPEWINMLNGVYDTSKCELLPHDPAFMLTHQVPFNYDKYQDCPTWRAFLYQVLVDNKGQTLHEWCDLMQEFYGLCLIPSANVQVAMFWVGGGSNGKGAATRCLENLVGREFCVPIPVEQLHDPYHRAELHGKRVGLVNEPDPKAMVKNGSHFKAITGGDSISARRPTEKVFNFTFTGKLVLSCNELPATRDFSYGYFRRIILINWRYTVPDELKDPDLDDKFRAELAGIFNWAMRGLERFRERGNKLTESKESKTLLEDYKTAERDGLITFIDEMCEKSSDVPLKVSTDLMYRAYRKWCSANGESVLSSTSVSRRLSHLGLKCAPSKIKVPGESNYRSVRMWFGITLRPETESLDEV